MNKRNWSFLAIIFIVLGFAGMAYQKFNFGDELPAYNHKWTFNQGELKSLSIESSYDVDMKFIDSPDGTNYIELSGNMDQEVIDKLQEITLSGGALNLPLNENFKMSFISINFHSYKQQVTVALAKEDSLDSIIVDMKSNTGDFKGLRGRNVELVTASGNITVDSITADHLKLKTNSGNIKGNHISADTVTNVTSGNMKLIDLNGSLTSQLTSGNLTVERMQGDVDATGTSGNFRFIDLTGNGKLKLTSGNITLSNQRSNSLDISISSGNVTLSKDSDFKGFYDLHTSTGDIKAPDSPLITKDIIKVRSTSGNIKIKD